MIVAFFSSGGCVNDAVNNQTNHQFTSIIVEHFINNARVCCIKSLVFNVYVCLNHRWRYEHHQF